MRGCCPGPFSPPPSPTPATASVGSERLITKIYFPRLAIPLASVGAAVVDFLIALKPPRRADGVELEQHHARARLAASARYLRHDRRRGPRRRHAPGALNVSYRDFRYVVPFMIQLWMFATPTVYMDPSGESGRLASLLALNPLMGLIGAFRAAALGGPINWAEFGISSACALLMLVVGCLYFRKVEDRFADII